ncbi:unnamed protein product [Parascedosporium putredinis]|uniref:Ima1 N-terminal domain-containing protein n=1 Tax=Parascedosporium putredinis TaxID=1442378 RepID=A0A9P1H720_9PEZI|nr:unnamed protein product [Parascedosporium putredinis]CAI7999417.1 unnamed protein product [Parascedosporium putredinis]
MAPFRRSHNLRCFYCNCPTGIRFEGQSEILCPRCDATNYLDEDGDITDPPVATTTASQSQAYAFQRSPTPQSPESSQSIFCAQCLKNQHLYTASLAQYFPDDPDHPDYPALERKYYKFRQDLEDRYPQMCADCEPKVLSKLNAAGYIAKTDFLRTAMEKSRANRTSPRRRTMMSLTDGLGRWLWYSAFVAQVLWHVSAVVDVVSTDLSLEARQHWLLRAWDLTSRFLPSTGSLIRISLQMTLLGIWWNPKFPEVVRGFSRPIVGLPKWYAFQGMLATARYLFPKIASLEVEHTEQANAQFAIHTFVAGLIFYVYILARKSVKLDTSPLFAPAEMPTVRQPRITRSGAKRETRLVSPFATLEPPPSRAPPRPSQAAYAEEMDWERTEEPAPRCGTLGSPKHSPLAHPSLAGISAGPETREPGSPATQAIKQDREIFTARFGGSTMLGGDKKKLADEGHVNFAPPSFFSQDNTGADPRNSLADMLSSGFSLSQEEENAAKSRSSRNAKRGLFSGVVPATPSGSSGGPGDRRGFRSIDAAFLVVIMRASLGMSALLTLLLSRDAISRLGQAGGASTANVLELVLCIAEVGAVGHLSLKVWTSPVLCDGCFTQGLWTIVVMLGHRLWNAIP